jgi:hypothetical protein
MSNVESTTDVLRNRVAEALVDENGLPPTRAALDVIMAVVRTTEWTDKMSTEQPEVVDYALDGMAALRKLAIGI